MKMRAGLILPLIAAMSACTAPAATSPPAGASASMETLNGTVAYRERIALQPDARVKVTLADVGRMDAPATVIAETEFASEGRQVPLPFALSYDPARLAPNGTYAVSARITDSGGRLLWITDTRVTLPAPGTPVSLMLVGVRN
ncbi:YbaY family lipoprotein [Novosphingobium sp. ST904]|uniref:YbaY family lipoprotein n=1 Tax=Novosphingobium sp. ST904 TaxID=1684385 RepID=UPI000ACBB541|nr:YbaY family lipoprotein [Novosphingobium sp. ST904]TCM43245.1 putative lipoprotein [Novosphingobium sp. ST904]